MRYGDCLRRDNDNNWRNSETAAGERVAEHLILFTFDFPVIMMHTSYKFYHMSIPLNQTCIAHFVVNQTKLHKVCNFTYLIL